MKITVENIDDFIRFARYLGLKKVRWEKEHFDILERFIIAGGWPKKKYKYLKYMGIKHYAKRKNQKENKTEIRQN